MKLRLRNILFLFLFTVFFPKVWTQTFTNISGTINSFSKVTQIIGAREVRVSPQIFSVGDTVLLIQMKGASISTAAGEGWGNHQSLRNTGHYEFLVIESINVDVISFSRNRKKNYDVSDFVQLIKVPRYNNARITSTLTTAAWDGNKGGILTFIVRNELRFEADINVTDKGFKGADAVELDDEICAVTTDSAFSETFNQAGRKGEGLALYYEISGLPVSIGTDFAKGRGRMINAGGGGNGKFAGGAGGSNLGSGGYGGHPDADCGLPYTGGSYQAPYTQTLGFLFTDTEVGKRLVLGGSGGSGTGKNLRTGGRGGNGGGMVIILAAKVNGNGYKIISNGENGNSGTGGGGGGGAGGTVVLHAEEFIGNLTVEVNGGNGGNSNISPMTGSGGGGGGGTLLVKQSSMPSQITLYANTGVNGEPAHGASIGNNGGFFSELKLTLNGFLFQSIQGDQKICEGIVPHTITGSVPFGGEAPYLFDWYESSDGVNFDPGSISSLPDYAPTALLTTKYFRRIVRDGSSPQIIDTSLPIKIEVFPKISNNTITAAQTICEGATPSQLQDVAPGPENGGPGAYTFIWRKEKITPGDWDTVSTSTSTRYYQPPALDQTAKYDRIVTTDYCTDISLPLTITVHERIGNNIISSNQTKCANDPIPFNLLVGGVPSGGGPGAPTYKWHVRTTGLYSEILGSNVKDYSPPGLPSATGSRQFYRKVEKGACVDTSNILTLTVVPVLTGNTIGSDQTICTGTQPLSSLGGGTIGGGNGVGSYSYNWGSSFDNFTFNPIAGANNQNYSPSFLTQDTYFRRIVTSGPCMDTSNNVKITVDPRPVEPITANADETFLRFKFSTRLQGSIPSIGTGTWSVEAGKGNFSFPNMENTEVSGLSFGLNKFRWSVSHLNCPVVFGEVDVMVEDIFRPNAFSPNGDGINDSLIFTGLSHSLNNELIIFNRQGNVVFSTKNYQIGNQKLWDGTDNSGNHLRDDTYYYTIIVENKFKYQGFIVLKR